MTYTDLLQEKYKDLYTKSTTHALTTELCKGTLSDERLLLYLVQDLKFFNHGMRVTTRAVSLCDDDTAMIKLAKQVGFFANDENDYFQIAIAECSETTNVENVEELLPDVKNYIEFLKQIYSSESYAEVITAIYVMELVYIGWADNATNDGIIPEDLPYKYKEWIELHSGEGFTKWVKLLKDEVDRLGESQITEETYRKTLENEINFFDACYNHFK